MRPCRQTDTEKFIEWGRGTANNLFDPAVVKYPSTYTRCVFDMKGPLLYTAVQKPLMIEALAFRPESGNLDRAVAMKELTQDTVSQAYLQGSGEIYFLCRDEDTSAFAANQLFEEVKHKVYRVRLSDLEKHENNPKNG